jgi:hypothetical protein
MPMPPAPASRRPSHTLVHAATAGLKSRSAAISRYINMTAMGKKRELRRHWQRACKLVLAEADVQTVSRALELALFMDAKLDVSKALAG